MTDYKKLEKMRFNNLGKFYVAIAIAMIPTLLNLSVIFIEQKQLSISACCATFFVYFFVLAYILFFFMGNQSFEHNIKQKILPDLLKNIIKDKGELFVKKNMLFNIDMENIDDETVDFSMLPEVENLKKYSIDGIDDILYDLQEKFDDEIENKSDELYKTYEVKFEALENEQDELIKIKEKTPEIKERLEKIEKLLTKMDEEDSSKIEAEIRKITKDLMPKYIKEINGKINECIENQYQNDIKKLAEIENMDNIGKLNSSYIERKNELVENIKNYNELKKMGDIIKINDIKEDNINNKEAQYDLKLTKELTHNKIFTKDTYYGTYCDLKFVIFDIKKMCILKLKDRFTDKQNNVVVVLKNNSNTSYAKIMTYDYPCFDIENKIQNYYFKVYTKTEQCAQSLINQKFIDLVNCLGKKYSYAFVNGSMYIIWNTPKKHLKLISLFKKIDDEMQIKNYTKDMQNILNIVETISKLAV